MTQNKTVLWTFYLAAAMFVAVGQFAWCVSVVAAIAQQRRQPLGVGAAILLALGALAMLLRLKLRRAQGAYRMPRTVVAARVLVELMPLILILSLFYKLFSWFQK